MSDNLKTALTAMGVILLVIILVASVAFVAHKLALRSCNQLGEQTGRATKLQAGQCRIEIAPGLFIQDVQVIYYLDHVRPVDQPQ